MTVFRDPPEVSWLSQAECLRRGLSVDEFVPPEGRRPSAAALAACSVCPVGGPDGPCAAERGKDIGLRGDGWLGGRHGERVRGCEDCGAMWVARGGAYRWCDECSKRRKAARDAAAKQAKRVPRACFACGEPFVAKGAAYMRCERCRERVA